MELKCGRDVLNVTNKDIVLFNGAVFILLTQTTFDGWHNICPTIAKAKAAKFVKDGILVDVTDKLKNKDKGMTYYRFNVSE